MSGGEPGAYHFYGPLWALLKWAYEVILQLGRQCVVPSGQITMPRCLKWSFLHRVVDFSRFFEGQLDHLVSMVPTPEKVSTPVLSESAGGGHVWRDVCQTPKALQEENTWWFG